jgi:hypothetical protein
MTTCFVKIKYIMYVVQASSVLYNNDASPCEVGILLTSSVLYNNDAYPCVVKCQPHMVKHRCYKERSKLVKCQPHMGKHRCYKERSKLVKCQPHMGKHRCYEERSKLVKCQPHMGKHRCYKERSKLVKCQPHDHVISVRGEAWAYKTSSTSPPFTEVSVPRQESERSCTRCVGEIDHLF